MSDSTQSDADKIRAKRLAKLGGPASSTSSNNDTPTAEVTGSPVTAATSPPIAQPNPSAIPSPQTQASTRTPNGTATSSNPFDQLGIKAENKPPRQITITPRSTSQKRESDGRPRSRQGEKPVENLEQWENKQLGQIFRITLKPEVIKDVHGHALTFVASTREDLMDQSAPLLLNVGVLEGAITEAATHAPGGKPFEYLLSCFKRVSRAIRATKASGPENPKIEVLKETRRLCMSYAIFAATIPEMFGDNALSENPLKQHLLVEQGPDTGIDQDFLNEAVARFEEDDTIKEAIVGAAEQMSQDLSTLDMLGNHGAYMRALRLLLQYPKIADAITQSPMFLPENLAPQEIETKSLLGPYFRLSPMQPSVAENYFSAPKTRDKSYISNTQGSLRMALRTHQQELYAICDAVVKKGGVAARGRMLDWFALTVNANHKKRAMRVDYKTVASDGFMVNVTVTLDQLCEPFMDASFSKIDRIDVEYLRREPRVDISDETKINADQKTADEFFAQKAEGTSNFISEVFFLTVAAHHYGTEAANTRLSTQQKTVNRMEKDLESFESERHKYINDPRYLARFEEHLTKVKKQIDDMHSMIHATMGVLLDDLAQARSMQFMRYVIVWLLRLASRQNLPTEQLRLPLPDEQPEVFKCLPEYFMEDIVDNFKFITQYMPQIITTTQAEEIMSICITFLRSTDYIKNPGVKSGLVTILFYGVHPYYTHSKGVLGDILNGSDFAHKHLLHALMRFYIEAESTGTHTQFFDKFNIRYEIFQVIKSIWPNTLYRENLAKEARVNTDFFVQFVNMLVNDVTFVLDESFSSFHKIHDLSKELKDTPAGAMEAEQRKEKEDLLADHKGRAKSYMDLTRETMEMLILFTENLAEAFTMPEIVTRLADMLDYNLESMVGPKRKNLVIEGPQQYGFHPKQLLSDIISVYVNLSGKDNFIAAIAQDGRSYKPSNFSEATTIMKNSALKSPEELKTWNELGVKVADAKAAYEAEEEDLGEVPDEFLDPLMADMMKDPVILPSSKQTIDRSTIRSHLLSDPTDPFNRVPLKIEEVIPDVEMKRKIDEFRAAAKERRKASLMDTTPG